MTVSTTAVNGAPRAEQAATLAERFCATAPRVEPRHPEYVVAVVEHALRTAQQAEASDIHFTPAETELEIACRIDGVLVPMATYPRTIAANIVSRLKVLAELLTYKTDVPQEGRIQQATVHAGSTNTSLPALEMRVSTFPTLFGEKGVVRLFAGSSRYRWLAELGLPDDLPERLSQSLRETAGAFLITGPAGSGKTTTAYACLREIQRRCGREKSLVTLEDPIETVLPGVSQSQVKRNAGFDYAIGLRSLMRQDPDVILVGEIRDRETAETVFQASLTGHLVLSTFHAGSACEAVSRLGDMGIEPYLLRTGLRGLLSQRLIRRLCDCATTSDRVEDQFGFPISRVRVPGGCGNCAGTGYHQRLLLAELLLTDQSEIGRAILSRVAADELQRVAITNGFHTLGQRAVKLIEQGLTSPAEIRRVLGFRMEAES